MSWGVVRVKRLPRSWSGGGCTPSPRANLGCHVRQSLERDRHSFLVWPKFWHLQQRMLPGHLALWFPRPEQREQEGLETSAKEFEDWAMFKIWSDKQAEGSAGVLPGRCMIGGWCMSGYQRTRSSSTTDFLFPNKEVLGRGSRLIEKAPKWRIKGGKHLIGGECWTRVFTKLTFFWIFFVPCCSFFELLERTSVHSFSGSSSQARFSHSQWGVPLFHRWKYMSKVELIPLRSL